jgi:hypothetical protein
MGSKAIPFAERQSRRDCEAVKRHLQIGARYSVAMDFTLHRRGRAYAPKTKLQDSVPRQNDRREVPFKSASSFPDGVALLDLNSLFRTRRLSEKSKAFVGVALATRAQKRSSSLYFPRHQGIWTRERGSLQTASTAN